MDISDAGKCPSGGTRNCKLKDGTIQPHNSTVQEDCNSCLCLGGERRCTGIDCGASNCMDISDAGKCPSGGTCVPKEKAGCLNPPCKQWAECSGDGTTSKQSGSEISGEVCLPNSTELNADCSKIHIVFKMEKLPKVTELVFIRFGRVSLSIKSVILASHQRK